MENSIDHSKSNLYTIFVLMLAASFVAMYITMYLNIYEVDHVYFSLNIFYIVCLAISAMALIIFFFMRKMYQNKQKNFGIVVDSIGLFFTALVVKTITVGNKAHGVVICKDGKIVYVTNSGDNTVSVIEVATKKVINTIPVGKKPNGISYLSESGGME